MVRFDKPSATIDEHIERLQERGMVFNNVAHARHFLSFVTYYRLCSYWLPFEIKSNGQPRVHRFQKGTVFESIVHHYEFDRELRILLNDAIERIEIALRTSWVSALKLTDGPHAHLNPAAFDILKDQYKQVTWSQHQGVSQLIAEHRRSQEAYVKHFRIKYDEALPPIWAAVEQMSFGSLSKWYANTKGRNIRRQVAEPFGLDEKIFISFLHHLVTVRNYCAHHARVWNRNYTKRWIKPRNGPDILVNSLVDMEPANPRESKRPFKIYNTVTMLSYLMMKVNPQTRWHERLLGLINAYEIDVTSMGFPDEYEQFPIWKSY